MLICGRVTLGAMMREMTEPDITVGTEVVVEELTTTEYKRPPVYAVGARGTVDGIRGRYQRSEEEADSELYSVRFESDDIWGEEADGNSSVYVDLWADCLQPVSSSNQTPTTHQQTND